MNTPTYVALPQQAVKAVQAMQAMTGCSARDALQALIVLTANNEPADRDTRIDALSFLLRAQPAPQGEEVGT